MLFDVIEVEPLNNYKILITFENSEKKIFDVSTLINSRPRWQELKNIELFNTVKVWEGTVRWIDGQDICPKWLYDEGENYEV
ncbi:DUF2442 domain-containing protein [Desulfosporosinus metallidurans]|uniref:DUF2442 domain-containing protein n=1 Tax=Desulfosporosinus metallidurans TaxID=1888891 RepID=A0A1Q8R2J0_9FIRM|nr:DUF2442 domain-containing protein [Desulfosporosinus metallidurans]OLN33835.1 hypothetical protein DSOL_0013 [Desulfosporosinus metallidurans]